MGPRHAAPIGRTVVGLLAATALAAALVGCQPNAADEVSAIQSQFQVVEQLRVTNLMIVDGCDYLVYSRGAFVTDLSSRECDVDVLGPHPRVAFDAQARNDLDSVRAMSQANRPRLQHAFVKFTSAGKVAPDSSFGFSQDVDYVYRPSADTRAGFVDSTCAEQVNADWYRTWSC